MNIQIKRKEKKDGFVDISSDFVKSKNGQVKNPSQSILSLKDAKNLFGQNVRVVTVPDFAYYPNCHSPDISDTESESDIKDEDLDNPKYIEKVHNKNSEQNEIHLKQLLDNEKNNKNFKLEEIETHLKHQFDQGWENEQQKENKNENINIEKTKDETEKLKKINIQNNNNKNKKIKQKNNQKYGLRFNQNT